MNILLPMRFLTKHASFEEEAECRILYIKDISDEKFIHENNRFYVPYEVPVLNDGKHCYLEKIYLGPHVHNLAGLGLKHLYQKRVQNNAEAKPLIIVKSNLPLA